MHCKAGHSAGPLLPSTRLVPASLHFLPLAGSRHAATVTLLQQSLHCTTLPSMGYPQQSPKASLRSQMGPSTRGPPRSLCILMLPRYPSACIQADGMVTDESTQLAGKEGGTVDGSCMGQLECYHQCGGWLYWAGQARSFLAALRLLKQ